MTGETMITADPSVVREVSERGFAIIPGALDAGEITLLKDELERAIKEDLLVLEEYERTSDKTHIDRWMVHNAMLRGPNLARLLEHELMQAYFTAFLSDTCILYSYQTTSLPPHGTNYGHRVHVDSPRLVPGYATNMGALFTLDDFTEENGATYFLPGSHQSMDEPTEEEFFSNAVRATCEAGSMMMINPRTWHMGGLNRTDKPRHALTIGACRSYMRSRFDYPRLIERTGSDVLDHVGEVGRRFLGYNVRMPTGMDEYYLPPERRLYKMNQG